MRFYPVDCNRCRGLLLAGCLMITHIRPSGVMPQLGGNALLGGWVILNLLTSDVMLPVVVHWLYTFSLYYGLLASAFNLLVSARVIVVILGMMIGLVISVIASSLVHDNMLKDRFMPLGPIVTGMTRLICVLVRRNLRDGLCRPALKARIRCRRPMNYRFICSIVRSWNT